VLSVSGLWCCVLSVVFGVVCCQLVVSGVVCCQLVVSGVVCCQLVVSANGPSVFSLSAIACDPEQLKPSFSKKKIRKKRSD
jgi:hypothetical protein